MIREYDAQRTLPASRRSALQGERQYMAGHSNRITAWVGLGACGLLAGLGALAYARWVEPYAVELARLDVTLENGAGRLPQEGLRILHLSDSHFRGGGRDSGEAKKIARVRKLTRHLDYDLLIHTGDFLHFDGGLDNVGRLLEAVPAPRIGAFGVFGNHDYTHYDMKAALPRMWQSFRADERTANGQRNAVRRAGAAATHLPRYVRYVRRTPIDGRRTGANDTDRLTSALEGWGMNVLHNRAVQIRDAARRLDVYLAGIDDVYEGRPHISNSLAEIPAAAPTLLLSHNPDILASPLIRQVDLLLSGHTHGGQLVLPILGPAHTQSWHLTRAEVAGYFRRERTHVYISRGLGEGIPLRFGARPQVTLITLRPPAHT